MYEGPVPASAHVQPSEVSNDPKSEYLQTRSKLIRVFDNMLESVKGKPVSQLSPIETANIRTCAQFFSVLEKLEHDAKKRFGVDMSQDYSSLVDAPDDEGE